jgi:hypothetical protein
MSSFRQLQMSAGPYRRGSGHDPMSAKEVDRLHWMRLLAERRTTPQATPTESAESAGRRLRRRRPNRAPDDASGDADRIGESLHLVVGHAHPVTAAEALAPPPRGEATAASRVSGAITSCAGSGPNSPLTRSRVLMDSPSTPSTTSTWRAVRWKPLLLQSHRPGRCKPTSSGYDRRGASRWPGISRAFYGVSAKQ